MFGSYDVSLEPCSLTTYLGFLELERLLLWTVLHLCGHYNDETADLSYLLMMISPSFPPPLSPSLSFSLLFLTVGFA